jgi:hypothetical protein
MSDGRWTGDASRARRNAALARYEVRTLLLLLNQAEPRLADLTRWGSPDPGADLDEALRQLDQADACVSMLKDRLTQARDATREAIGRYRGVYRSRDRR